VKSGNTDAAEMLRAMRSFLGENDMMAYLCMMAVRLLELRRVLKETGSLYLHCDPTASHYLKIVLDSIFGASNFRNEIVWKRTTAHSNVYRNYGSITDIIFYYSKDDRYVWNQLYKKPTQDQLEAAFPNVDSDGRRWRSENMRNPGIRPNLHYPYKASNGVTYQPHPNGWTVSLAKMKQLDKEKRLHFPTKPTGRLRLKLYADESPGTKLQNLWDDISPIGAQARERLGYPTQKPLALLERIILASSNEGDVVLDPFCGCGTAIHAAQKLNRHWIGIDVTHLAISLIEKRLKDAFPGIEYEVHGAPKDIEGAEALAFLDKYQFQWWAVSLVDAVPYGGKKKGADMGIDGIIYFKPDGKTTEKAVVSVKGGKNVSVTMVKDLRATIDRQKAPIGIFITLAPATQPMIAEAASAGFYETEYGKYPRLQILTIEELFAGKKPNIPLVDPTAFRKAAREEKEQGKLAF
jgi:site-specific DNA-methyltransferase (adenine-specific)